MELIEHGGWVLVVIFALSLLAWSLIIHKWFQLRAESRNGFAWIESAIDDVRQGKTAAVKAACLGRPGLAGRMMLKVLEGGENGYERSGKYRNEVAKHESTRLCRHLGLISAIGAALPLLGLLGTVLGMTKTFGALTKLAAGETRIMMAGGISEALITTQAGLVTALPVVLMCGILTSRIRRKMDESALVMKRFESAVGEEQHHV